MARTLLSRGGGGGGKQPVGGVALVTLLTPVHNASALEHEGLVSLSTHSVACHPSISSRLSTDKARNVLHRIRDGDGGALVARITCIIHLVLCRG